MNPNDRLDVFLTYPMSEPVLNAVYGNLIDYALSRTERVLAHYQSSTEISEQLREILLDSLEDLVGLSVAQQANRKIKLSAQDKLCIQIDYLRAAIIGRKSE
ncbi:MAG: hypothetical protein AABX51_01780 [Nanoarchaeota archaeon]